MLSVNQSSANISFLEKLSQQREEQAEKLASGKRINKAADDPAGLQIVNRLSSQINQDQQLSFNAQDQANINNVEAAALSAINDGLLRAQEKNEVLLQSAIISIKNEEQRKGLLFNKLV